MSILPGGAASLVHGLWTLPALGRKDTGREEPMGLGAPGLASGAATGTALSLEIVTSGFELPGTTY